MLSDTWLVYRQPHSDVSLYSVRVPQGILLRSYTFVYGVALTFDSLARHEEGFQEYGRRPTVLSLAPTNPYERLGPNQELNTQQA